MVRLLNFPFICTLDSNSMGNYVNALELNKPKQYGSKLKHLKS